MTCLILFCKYSIPPWIETPWVCGKLPCSDADPKTDAKLQFESVLSLIVMSNQIFYTETLDNLTCDADSV